MKVLIDIGHPAHVHFYKNTIKELEAKGHEVLVTARDKDVAINLL
jgi:predicted glycosyltransferase